MSKVFCDFRPKKVDAGVNLGILGWFRSHVRAALVFRGGTLVFRKFSVFLLIEVE